MEPAVLAAEADRRIQKWRTRAEAQILALDMVCARWPSRPLLADAGHGPAAQLHLLSNLKLELFKLLLPSLAPTV
jgi:hypothetical protein